MGCVPHKTAFYGAGRRGPPRDRKRLYQRARCRIAPADIAEATSCHRACSHPSRSSLKPVTGWPLQASAARQNWVLAPGGRPSAVGQRPLHVAAQGLGPLTASRLPEGAGRPCGDVAGRRLSRVRLDVDPPVSAVNPESSQEQEPPKGAATNEPRAILRAPWVLSLYFAEGLPFSVVRQVSSQFFTSAGASLPAIGSTSLYGLAWNLKLLWSPLVDRYGTTRRWLLLTEAALALVVAAIAWPAGARDLPMVARVLGVVAVLAATHDIAIDGFYLEALDKGAQAKLSGVRVAAYRAALLVGNGLLVMLAGYSWRACFLVAGALLAALAVGHARALPVAPPKASRAAPPRYVDAFTSFLRQPHIGLSLAFILLYNAGDSLMFAMSAPFLKSLGFGDFGRGAVGALGTVASIGGSIGGGMAIARFGLRRMLPRIAVGQSLAILLYVALAHTRPVPPVVAAVAVVEQLAAGVGGSAFVVFLMRRCGAEHRAAHFAIATALMSIAATFAGYASGYVAKPLGYPAFFTLAFAVSVPGAVLAWVVPKD